ncbi:MAG: PaaI family thioesterase [Actinomycetota bacterium]
MDDSSIDGSTNDPSGPAIDDAVDRVLRALRPRIEIVDGVAVATLEPLAEHRGRPGWLHGGFAATVLDHVCAGAATNALGARVVTGRLDLRYPHPVPLDGGPYRVEATAEAGRGRMVKVAGAILDTTGRRLVEAKSLFVAIEPMAD